MTSMPLGMFLETHGIEPSKENKKRWRDGWTLGEIREGEDYIGRAFEQERASYKIEKRNNGHQNIGWYSESII